MDIRQNILNALRQSLVANTEAIAQSTKILLEMHKNDGFCMALMQIVDHPQIQIHVKQAALIQFKNIVKSQWKPRNSTIKKLGSQQKEAIKNSLVVAMTRCAKSYQLIKLYREIISIIVGYQYRNWLPVQEILSNLNTKENISPIFHCIIGICSSFKYCTVQEQKEIYSEFIKIILPAVLSIVQQNKENSQVIYLAVKLFYKAINYDVPVHVKWKMNDWMQLLLMVIKVQAPEYQAKVTEVQARNSPEFYYHHCKKWAYRILLKYAQKLAKEFTIIKSKNDHHQFSINWYQVYGPTFIQTVVQQLLVPNTKNTRYFQLRTLYTWVNDKPKLMICYAAKLQYEILLQHLQITPLDEGLANQDVVEYLRNQEQNFYSFSIKKAATELWQAYTKIHAKNKVNGDYVAGPLFESNMKFIANKIESQNLIQKELGMYLLYSLKGTIIKVPAAKAIFKGIICQHVLPLLRHEQMLIRSRANDVFTEYGSLKFEYQILKQSAELIYQCLSQDPHPLVNIKAAFSFQAIIVHKEAQQLVYSYLGSILQLYLNLIKKYDLQQLVSSLQFIIANFSQKIQPYAIDLFTYLSQTFIEMFNKYVQQDQKEKYEGQLGLAATSCLQTLSLIISSPLDPCTRLQIQEPFVKICKTVFLNDPEYFLDSLMPFMNVFLFKMEQLTERTWFFFQVLIYYMVGFPKQSWGLISNLQLDEEQKNILVNIRFGDNTEYLNLVFPVLRNYITKCEPLMNASTPETKDIFFKTCLYLVSAVYKKYSSTKQNKLGSQCEYNMCISTNILINLIQTFEPEVTKPHTQIFWQFTRFNHHYGKSYSLKLINSQLIAVIFWKHAQQITKYLINPSNQYVHQMMKNTSGKQEVIKNNLAQQYIHSLEVMKKFYSQMSEAHERKRLILCYSRLLIVAPQLCTQLYSQIPTLFKILIKLLKTNCRSRVQELLDYQQALPKFKQTSNLYETKPNRQDLVCQQLGIGDEQYLGFTDKDIETDEYEQDYWEEQFEQDYDSVLSKIDQLQYFKDTMSHIQKTSPQYYQKLIQIVPNRTIIRISAFVNEALQVTEAYRIKV